MSFTTIVSWLVLLSTQARCIFWTKIIPAMCCLAYLKRHIHCILGEILKRNVINGMPHPQAEVFWQIPHCLNQHDGKRLTNSWVHGRNWLSHNRCGSTLASTVLRKSVRFFIMNMFLIINLKHFLSWNLNDSEAQERGFKGVKNPKTFLREPAPGLPLEACAFDAHRSVFIGQSVSIYHRSVPEL